MLQNTVMQSINVVRGSMLCVKLLRVTTLKQNSFEKITPTFLKILQTGKMLHIFGVKNSNFFGAFQT